MILVNDIWHQIYDLQDISEIIRENYNMDLADEMDKLIPEHTGEEYEELEKEQSENEDIIRNLKFEINNLKSEIDELNERIEELEGEQL